MKEKDFEVIVPAYEALEAELEEILGGGSDLCIIHCTKCQPNNPGSPCVPAGGVYPLDSGLQCCEGLIGVVDFEERIVSCQSPKE